MEEVDVAVVGAGVVGLSSAWRLALAGRRAVVFERFPLGHDRGSSHGPTRIFRFAYDDPVYVRLAQRALPLWRELEHDSGEHLLEITGGFDVGEPSYLERCEAALRTCGAQVDLLRPAARRERFPWFEAEDGPALYSPDTGVIAADAAMRALTARARNAGAEIMDDAPIESLEIAGDVVRLIAASGEIVARRCVVAAGAWVRELLSPAGFNFPVRVTREQVFYFRAASPVVPFIHRGEMARYCVPAFGGAPGVKIAEHMTGAPTSAEARGFDQDREGAKRVSDYVRATLPSFDPDPVGFESCLYTTTPDEGFVFDQTGPLVVASACSGHGFKFGPITGEIVASLCAGADPPISLESFSITRFV
jgi:monomeric sarcosine oxidase